MTTPTGASPQTNDLRVTGFQPLIPPAALRGELPLGSTRAALVESSRRAVNAVLTGEDDRLLLVVGPCSVHDPAAARDYAHRLAAAVTPLSDDLCVVMRVCFEKPRTTVGWKGLINDPHLDGTHDVELGLRMARQVLLDVLDAGLPVGCEFLEPTGPQYISDAVTWGAIGARTPESQVHRQLASGLSMPVGFKNATDGDVTVAIDGCRASAGNHVFFGIDDQGHASIVSTSGNPDCHVILRGGRGGPNHGPEDVRDAIALLAKSGLESAGARPSNSSVSWRPPCAADAQAATDPGFLGDGVSRPPRKRATQQGVQRSVPVRSAGGHPAVAASFLTRARSSSHTASPVTMAAAPAYTGSHRVVVAARQSATAA